MSHSKMDVLVMKMEWRLLVFCLLFPFVNADTYEDDDVFDAIPSQFEGKYATAYVASSGSGVKLQIQDANNKVIEWTMPSNMLLGVGFGYGLKDDIYFKEAFVKAETAVIDSELGYQGVVTDKLVLDRKLALIAGGSYGLMPNPATVIKVQTFLLYMSDQFELNKHHVDISRMAGGAALAVIAGVTESYSVDLSVGVEVDLGHDQSASITQSVFDGAIGGVSTVSASGFAVSFRAGVGYKV